MERRGRRGEESVAEGPAPRARRGRDDKARGEEEESGMLVYTLYVCSLAPPGQLTPRAHLYAKIET